MRQSMRNRRGGAAPPRVNRRRKNGVVTHVKNRRLPPGVIEVPAITPHGNAPPFPPELVAASVAAPRPLDSIPQEAKEAIALILAKEARKVEQLLQKQGRLHAPQVAAMVSDLVRVNRSSLARKIATTGAIGALVIGIPSLLAALYWQLSPGSQAALAASQVAAMAEIEQKGGTEPVSWAVSTGMNVLQALSQTPGVIKKFGVTFLRWLRNEETSINEPAAVAASIADANARAPAPPPF